MHAELKHLPSPWSTCMLQAHCSSEMGARAAIGLRRTLGQARPAPEDRCNGSQVTPVSAVNTHAEYPARCCSIGAASRRRAPTANSRARPRFTLNSSTLAPMVNTHAAALDPSRDAAPGGAAARLRSEPDLHALPLPSPLNRACWLLQGMCMFVIYPTATPGLTIRAGKHTLALFGSGCMQLR
jgi:hypothetical protein